MNRRHLLLVSLGTVLGGCARFTDDPGSGPVVLPTDPATRVASRIVAGGFVPIGYNEITPPRLAVYADGTAIADAARQLSLTSAETTDLVRGLRRDLSGLPASPKPLGKNAVADAATTTLTVLGADGKTISVSAYALGILHYDAALTAADERIRQAVQKGCGARQTVRVGTHQARGRSTAGYGHEPSLARHRAHPVQKGR
jgi:hypothetical protein